MLKVDHTWTIHCLLVKYQQVKRLTKFKNLVKIKNVISKKIRQENLSLTI